MLDHTSALATQIARELAMTEQCRYHSIVLSEVKALAIAVSAHREFIVRDSQLVARLLKAVP